MMDVKRVRGGHSQRGWHFTRPNAWRGTRNANAALRFLISDDLTLSCQPSSGAQTLNSHSPISRWPTRSKSTAKPSTTVCRVSTQHGRPTDAPTTRCSPASAPSLCLWARTRTPEPTRRATPCMYVSSTNLASGVLAESAILYSTGY